MISSYEAGFNLRERTEPGAFRMLTFTMLSGKSFTWQDMVHACNSKFPGYVALVVFDESTPSNRLRRAIAERYLDLDRVTGDALLVLSTVPPPRDWFRFKLDQISRLPLVAQQFHEKEVYLIGTKEGESTAQYNSQKLLAEFFEPTPDLPCICFLWERSSMADPGTPFIYGQAFSVSGYQTSGQVYSLFETLSRFAREHMLRVSRPAEFATDAFSIWKPLSLRWKNAALHTMRMLEFVKKWRETAEL